MTDTTTATGPAAAPDERRTLRRLAYVLVVGGVAPLLDTTVVNVALRRMGGDLHAPVAGVQWVVTGYLLTLALAIPVSGPLTRRFGARPVWLGALAAFLAASVLAGLAWNLPSLVAFRAVQGVAAGLISPLVTTILFRAAGTSRLGKLIATVTLPAAVVPILGPVVGGLLVAAFGWRAVFLVNVPLVVAALALAVRFVPADPPVRDGRRTDVLGLVLLSAGLAALLYGLTGVGHGRQGHGVVAPAVGLPLLAGLALVAAYALTALRTRAVPAVDLRLFRHRRFAASSVLLFLAGLSMFGALLLLPLFHQSVLGEGVLVAGLLLAPQGIGSLVPRLVVGRLTDRLGPRPVVLAGAALTVFGTLPYALAGPHPDLRVLGAGLFVRGAGLAAVTIAVMDGAFGGLAREQVADASSAVRIVQQLGGAFGAAVLAVVLERGLAGAGPGVAGAATAYGHTFWWTLALTAVAVVPALLLPGRPRTP